MSSSRPISAKSSLIGKTGIFLFMLSVIVLFGVLSVAFIATPEKKAEPFFVPWIFYANTLLLIASSVLLHLGWLRRHQTREEARKFIRFALIFGIGFLFAQAYGCYEVWSYYQELSQDGIANPKRDYLYLLSVVHGLHLLGGLLFLTYVFAKYRTKGQNVFETALFFWHFLGILWVYLLAVLALT
jgi:cytochrome c oxidase subunit 3